MAETSTQTPLNGEKSKKHFIAKTPIRRLMKSEGAILVSEDAVALLVSKLEEIAIHKTKEALKTMKDDGRKRLSGLDVKLSS